MPVTLITQTLAEGQAEDVVVCDTERQSCGLFSHIVVATARTARHAAALKDRVVRALKSAGHKKLPVEESPQWEWTLIDCGDVVVHIMRAEARQRYQLESLWEFENIPGGE